MADNIPSLEDLLKSIQEDDDNIPGLDDLLDDIRSEGAPQSSSALATIPKKEDDLVEEEIDPQILSILGLEDVFDLTYEEYYRELRTAAAAGRMPGSQMSTESIELVTEELKRVKGKTGRFKVKPKKLDINKVLDRKQPSPPGAIVKAQKLIPSVAESAPEVQPREQKPPVDVENLQDDLMNGIGNILESLITIRTVLQSQGKTEQQAAKEDRKETEKKKKKEREAALEKKKPKSPILKALTKPVDDFFGAIKRFFTNVLLGSVVLGIFKWLKDPKNKESIDKFTNFLENNAGLILGGLLAIAALPIAATLFNLSIGIISGIGVLTGALTKFGAFLVSPLGLGLLGALGLYGLAAKYRQIRDENIEQRMKDAERGTELIEQGGKPVMANTPSGVATLTGDRRPWWQKISQSYDQFIRTGELPNLGLAGIKNALFGKKDILKSEDLDELRKEYNKVNNELYNKIQAYKSGDIRFNKDIENLSIQKDALSRRINEVEKFVPKSPEPEDPYAGADGLQRQLDDLAKEQPPAVQPQTPLMPGLPPSAAQPGAGPAGNPVGGGSVVEYITGDATHPNFEYKGHGTTENYHDHIAFKTKEDKERAKLALRQAGIQIGSENRPWDTDSYHGAGLAIDIPGAQWGGRGAIGETEYAGSRKVRAVLAAAGFSGAGLGNVGLPNAQPRPAQVAQTAPPTPSIPSPTGRGNIVPLPIPTGGGAQQASSGTSPNQAPVPRFSSEDPNNTTTMVVRAIYNIVG